MKNPTTKLNKSKLVARGMLLVFLLTSVVSFVGCSFFTDRRKYIINTQSDPYCEIMLKATSDVNNFPIDDVTFDLYIGLNGKNWFDWFLNGKCEPERENTYYLVYMLTDKDYRNLVLNNESILNYSHIVKEIPYKETVETNKYNFINPLFLGEYFNCCEKITIPKEILLDGVDEHFQGIHIGVCLAEKSTGSNEYVIKYYHHTIFELSYRIVNDRVDLDFSYRNRY